MLIDACSIAMQAIHHGQASHRGQASHHGLQIKNIHIVIQCIYCNRVN